MLILAKAIALFHGLVIVPALVIVPLVLVYGVIQRRRYQWLEYIFISVGILTVVSYLVSGGCWLTLWQQKLLLRYAPSQYYRGGFIRHELGFIGIHIPDIATTIGLIIFGLLGVVTIYIQHSRAQPT